MPPQPEPEAEPVAQVPPPDEVVPPPRAVEPTVDDVEPRAARRHRATWKHVAAAAVLGLSMGVGVPGAFVAAERAATADSADALRGTALEYIGAIAARDSRRAAQMVPIRGLAYIAPPEVLRSAAPIEVPEVELVHIEGDRGTAEVHYRVYGLDVFRTLQAERVDGAWQLRTSLAEIVDTADHETSVRGAVAGVPLGGFLPMMLYPGVYTLDRVEGTVLAAGGDVFSVDGDPRTATQPVLTVTVVPAIAERATELARSAVEDCQLRPGCLVPPGSRLRFVDRMFLARSDPEGGTVDLVAGFTAIDAPEQDYFEMQVRVLVDEHDRPVGWQCGQPGALGGPTHPCGP